MLRRLSFLAACLLAAGPPGSGEAAPPDFDRTVAPLLAQHCLDCHSGPRPKGGLDLSRRKPVLKGGKGGPVVSAGKPDDSLLWQRVRDDEMPPKKHLSQAEKDVLRGWIATGAAWGTDPIDPFRFTTDRRAGYDWWALQPVRRPPPPAVRDLAPVRNPIDRFILARLEEKGLHLAVEADRRTLARRLYFDLLGLPPAPEEVERFAADPDPLAYERLVDRLLASPHYGERWARHWLDVVRYGESDGFERNTPRPNSWHYRDWVVRALNADLPYDEFCRLQLAGDVLAPGDADAARATGFLVAGVHNTVVGGSAEMQELARQDELEDLVGAVGQTFLGLTINCGRCHDHKFDPVAQKDFYRLAAALAGVQHGERDLPAPSRQTDLARLQSEMERIEKEIAEIEGPARRAALAGRGKEGAGAPVPLAAWDFRGDLRDRAGTMHGSALGPVRLAAGGAAFDGKTAFMRTVPLPRDLREKTLEAWVRLDTLGQRGGGVLSLQTPVGDVFDAIVFGEQQPGRWMAGSDFFRRTRPLGGPAETEAAGRPVHVAVAYHADGTIAFYRDGRPYGTPYKSDGPVTFKAGAAVILFGCRHEPAGGNKMLAGTVHRARLYDRALSAEQVAASAAAGGDFVSEEEIKERLGPKERALRDDLAARLAQASAERARLQARAAQKAYVALSRRPPPTRLYLRGQVTEPGEVVAPGGVAALAGADLGLAADAPEGERRRRLAAWLTRPDNPLFARVLVNRLWHYHFGTGIVETPNDFGFNGGRPSHPELLDFLAAEFVIRGFRLKEMHRLLVTSAAYRQSSAPHAAGLAADADSRLLWRKKPLRLEGEVLRDTMLAAAGLLNTEVGGKGFSDYRENPNNGTTYYEPFDPAGLPPPQPVPLHAARRQPGSARQLRLPRPRRGRPAPLGDDHALAGAGAVEQRLRPAPERRPGGTGGPRGARGRQRHPRAQGSSRLSPRLPARAPARRARLRPLPGRQARPAGPLPCAVQRQRVPDGGIKEGLGPRRCADEHGVDGLSCSREEGARGPRLPG
jgi:hypothetical protein